MKALNKKKLVKRVIKQYNQYHRLWKPFQQLFGTISIPGKFIIGVESIFNSFMDLVVETLNDKQRRLYTFIVVSDCGKRNITTEHGIEMVNIKTLLKIIDLDNKKNE